MKKISLKFLVLFLIIFAFACESEEDCETKESCFTRPDGSQECFDAGTNCVGNNFGF